MKGEIQVKLSKYIAGYFFDPKDAAAAEKYAFAKIEAAGNWDIMVCEHNGQVRQKSIDPYLDAWECSGEGESEVPDYFDWLEEHPEELVPAPGIRPLVVLDKDEADILLSVLMAYKPKNMAEARVCVRAEAKLEAIRGQD